MKRIPVIMILGIFTPLLFVQVYFGTIKESRAEETSVNEEVSTKAEAPVNEEVSTKAETSVKEEVSTKAEETPAVLLADKHKTAGVECSDCHEETPPAKDVPTEMCMKCHEDYKERAASYISPHDAHHEYTNCGDCHHSHKTSENQCLSCHSFNLKTP
jgi:hypothetical protein